MLGLYAVMSYLVAQRVREIGVRMALGATTSDVTRLALGQAARLTALGLAIGVRAAIALGRLMEAGLLGVIVERLRDAVRDRAGARRDRARVELPAGAPGRRRRSDDRAPQRVVQRTRAHPSLPKA